MPRTLLNLVLLPAVLVLVAVGTWLVMNRDPVTASSSDFASCWTKPGSASQIDCTADRIAREIKRATAGPGTREAAVFDVVRYTERRAAKDPRLSQACHSAMHPIGRAEGARYASADATPQFPEASSQLCTAGYVHGVAEGYLSRAASPDISAVFPKLCHQTDAQEGCAHGIGHALLRAQSETAPSKAVESASSACSRLPDEYPTNCLNGVYMELALRREPTTIEPELFVKACEAIRDPGDALTCWGYLVQNLNTNEIALSEMPTWCARPSLPGRYSCVEEYGRILGIEDIALCESSANSVGLQRRCVEGAVGLQVGSGHVSENDARGACTTLDASALTAHCDGAVDRYARGRDQVEAA